MKILTDYNRDEMNNYERNNPNQYKQLMNFVSDCSTTSIFDKDHDNDSYILAITIPIDNCKDYACAIFSLCDTDFVKV
jgi:hypothetical protein